MSRLAKAMLALGALGLLSTSTFVCQRVAERGRFTSAYSTYGSGPKGARALFLLAERLGARPARWSQDLAALPERGMLVALGDCESGMARELSRYEEEELARWVESGGVLLVAGVRHYLPEAFGVSFEREPRCEAQWRFLRTDAQGDEEEDETPPELLAPPEPGASVPAEDDARGDHGDTEGGFAYDDEIVWTSPVDAPLLGLDAVPMRRPGRFDLAPKAEYRTILSMPDAPDFPDSPVQREVGVVVQHGKGRVIALASGSMLQNRALQTADGGVLFARLLRAFAPAGPVLFDEYHLGVGERRSMMRYLRQAGATPFIAQLVFCALLLLWRGGARFGGVRQPPEVAPAGTASFVAALGGLFARAGDPAGAAHVLVKQALARIAAHHHLPKSSARKLANELTARGLRDAAAAVRSISDASTRAAREPGGGLTRLSRELDAAVARACA